MKSSLDREILLRYLDDECSESEKEAVNEWINENASNKSEFERIKKIWESPGVPCPKPDIELALSRVWQKIDELPGTVEKRQFNLGQFVNDAFKELLATPLPVRVGIVTILLLGLYFIISVTTTPKMNEVFVATTEIKEIVLEDSSKVTLDAGSKLSFPDEFTKGKREVQLTGEAFFEITADPGKPFVINAKEGMITVLGTKFNVRALDDSDNIVVSVAEGIVSLMNRMYEGDDLHVIIHEGFQSIIKNDSPPSVPTAFKVTEAKQWIDREMSFSNVKLNEVFEQLSRWYGLEFELPYESLRNDRVTIYIENKPIEDILEVIALVIGMEYSLDGKVVKFSKNTL